MYNIDYLFRYRDLVADTLPQHRKVAEKIGYCWWGWWKRPNEPSHSDVWRRLKEQTADGTRVQIGLFHSGTGEVHLATINGVVEPVEDEYENLRPIMPPEEELKAVPAYYRASSQSRAWLRIESISTTPHGFFGSHSFREAPQLAGHGRSQLVRYINKRIVDADELRTMDTTIWQVRRAVEGDRTERILTLGSDLEQPLSRRPVNCPGEWILHLTDPHFSLGRFRREHAWRLESEEGAARPTMVDAIHSSIVAAGRDVGAVLLTGDLTYVASPDEFQSARSSLSKLVTGMLGLNLEHLIVVPGNHDVAWTNSGTYSDDAPVDVAPSAATQAYREFFLRLYGYEANDHLSMARRLVFPAGNVVDIAALNSSSLEQGANYLAGMGRVQEAAYREAAQALKWDGTTGLSLRILALHHHLALTEDLESPAEYGRGFGIAIDAARTLRMAARDGVHLALHGHKHRSFLWRTGAYELPENTQDRWSLGNINIVGGGTAGSTASEGEQKFFNLLRVAGSAVELEMYRSRNLGAFQKFMKWRARLCPGDGGRQQISPWEKVDSLE